MHTIFEWSKIDKQKLSGTAKLKCPACIDQRKDKRDTPLYVNFNSGVAKCFNCEALSFRDSVKKETEKTFKLPEQNWRNYTTLSDNLVKYLEGRKISQHTAIALGLTEEEYYQPQLGKIVNNVVFNYFEGETVVNKKYRSASKKFTQSTGTKSILYNINSAIGQKELYIVEGEMDVLSLCEIDIKNVVSIPNGANDNDGQWINSEPYLKDIKKFYIATDNDEKGNDVAEKIAQRLGRYRCERVKFEGKDANEDLINGVLEKTIYQSVKYPVSGTFTVFDMYDKMLSLYDNGLPPTIYPKNECFSELNEIFKTMKGHLVVSTGIPSHGKSNFTEWYILNMLVENDYKASFFSPEHQPMELHQSTFVQKVIGKNYFSEVDGVPRVSKIEIAKYAEWANEKIYLTSPENGQFATWDWIFEKFTEQMFNYGIDFFVIDAYNKVEHTGGKTERENISKVLSRLTSFCQQNNVTVFLVAHPTKMQLEGGLYRSPTLYDVSGSADFRNQTHDGFCIYRYFEDKQAGQDPYVVFTNLKTKYSFQGEMGKKAEFEYHKPSGRFYKRFSRPFEGSLLDGVKTEKEPVYEIPTVAANDAFGTEYNPEEEIPF